MNEPVFHGPVQVAPDILSLAGTLPVPGFGALHTNAFLIESTAPVLVDTGAAAWAEATVQALCQRIDPRDLRYVWLTHADPDHVGALEALLALAPQARIVTNYLGMGKLGMRFALSPDRFHLLNPGQSLDVGDRALQAVALPSYDAPETLGIFDPRSRALFSSDCFGALLDERDAKASVESADAVAPELLEQGLVTWTTVDAPWLRQVGAAAFHASREALTALSPALVLSAHLGPARGALPRLLTYLEAARRAPAFVGPDQAALEAMLSAA